MTEIKTLKNYAFRRILIALISAMFVVLLGGYRKHIESTNSKLASWTEPLEQITQTILSQSGSSDDSLARSSLVEIEQQISGLNLTPSISNSVRRYVSNLYTVAGAFATAKASLPQTNDWHYLFDRGTIDLLQTNSFLSGDVVALYSGRETIRDAITYLSGSLISANNSAKKEMSSHNLSVALASQIGVEVLLCTKSYDALAVGRKGVSLSFSGLIESYQRQLGYLGTLTGNDAAFFQCIDRYSQQLRDNISDINQQNPTITKLTALAGSRQRTYQSEPLQCPIGIDLKQDITDVRQYAGELQTLLASNQMVEGVLTAGSLAQIGELCQSVTSEQGTGGQSLQDFLSVFSGAEQQIMQPTNITGQNNNTGSFIALPEDTQKIIDDIYQRNTQYINLMQQSQRDSNYSPLRRIQQLFQEFYGNTDEFHK